MKKKVLIIASLWLIPFGAVFAQSSETKAMFIYNFVRMIEWPGHKYNEEIVIGVYNNAGLSAELKTIAGNTQSGQNKLRIRDLSVTSGTQDCHFLIFTGDVIADLVNSKSVIITDDPEPEIFFSDINLIQREGRQSFEINLKKLERKGLYVNCMLIRMGRVIG